MATTFKEEGNKAFEKGQYQDAIGWYTKGITRDPDHVNLYTNRAMARFKLELWDDSLNDCLEALTLKPRNFKAYFYLAQAQLKLRHPNEALSSALTAYEIGVKTGDASTAKACDLVLMAKKAKWEAKERERIRNQSELLCELEAAIKKTGFEQESQTEDPAEQQEIAETTKRKIEELHSTFALADPVNMRRREVPDYMVDQISFAFMHDPVITKSGQSYERSTIEAHLKISETDPLTREPLRKFELRPNLALKQACAEFLEKNGWAVDW